MVNAIHDMDLLRFLCGDVVTVQAMASNSVRGFENEDTAVVLLKFDSGALGTMNISDTITSPTSWELSSGENSDFAVTQESCYWIGGRGFTLTSEHPLVEARKPRTLETAYELCMFSATKHGAIISAAEQFRRRNSRRRKSRSQWKRRPKSSWNCRSRQRVSHHQRPPHPPNITFPSTFLVT